MNREQSQELAAELMKLLTDLAEVEIRWLALKRKVNRAYFAVDDALDNETN